MAQQPIIYDLDQRPELAPQALELFRSCPPGRDHAVIGMPSRMGRTPRLVDLEQCLGVVVACDHKDQVIATLGICGYSDEQVTLWGPVIHRGHLRRGIGSHLLSETRQALRDGGFGSCRVLVDSRNREARAFFLANGLTPWKDNDVYERKIDPHDLPDIGGVTLAKPSDHQEIADLLVRVFPESGHLDHSLVDREREGYRHYILQSGGTIVGVTAVRSGDRRSWLSLVAIAADQRGQGHGRTLIQGTLAGEASHGANAIALEVLYDNYPAQQLYTGSGFQRRWSATILTGPV